MASDAIEVDSDLDLDPAAAAIMQQFYDSDGRLDEAATVRALAGLIRAHKRQKAGRQEVAAVKEDVEHIKRELVGQPEFGRMGLVESHAQMRRQHWIGYGVLIAVTAVANLLPLIVQTAG